MTATAADHAVDVDHDSHVSDWVYVKIAILLGVLTAIEVFTYFESVHNMSDGLLVLILSSLMVVKFFLVAAYFMHLKYDNAIFTKMVVAGLVLAYVVYGVAAFAMDWLPGWNWVVKVIILAVPPIVASAWLLVGWQGGDEEHADATH